MESNWSIQKYRPKDSSLWDALVAGSRQGTLLHFRDYMDYHSDRFTDCSLIAERKGKPIAILPANLTPEGTLISHQGLTYAGWITPRDHFDGTDMLDLFRAWTQWSADQGIREIIYKPTPHIYHKLPAEEDIYALFRFGATATTVNLSTVIDMREIPPFNSQQKRNLKKAISLSPWIREAPDAGEFMPLVADCLLQRHGAAPVHSEAELTILKSRFPDSIRLFTAGTGTKPDAAVCIYDTNGVAHCQYIATSQTGRDNGILAFLFRHLIDHIFPRHRYFDFGTSNEDAGRILNAGLIHQKTGLGGRGLAYPSFRLSLNTET